MLEKTKGVAVSGYLYSCIVGLRKQWFLIGMVVVILLAKLYPGLGCKGGLLKPEFTVKYFAVSFIFLNSGLSMKTEDLKKSLLLVKLHLFIQLYTFALIPLVATLVIKMIALNFGMLPVYIGLHIVCCLPPPVSTAVLLTKAAHGNEAAAIFNSVIGSFLGIVITPLLLLSLVGSSATPSLFFIFGQLMLTVVLPLVLGQAVKPYIQTYLDHLSPPHSAIGSGILLFIIYTTFCDAFKGSAADLEPRTIITAVFLVVIFQVMFLSLAFALSLASGMFTRSEIVAILFCSTHKSLTLGLPILQVVYANTADISLLTLPLLIYHPTQILLGSTIVPSLQKWANEEPM